MELPPKWLILDTSIANFFSTNRWPMTGGRLRRGMNQVAFSTWTRHFSMKVGFLFERWPVHRATISAEKSRENKTCKRHQETDERIGRPKSSEIFLDVSSKLPKNEGTWYTKNRILSVVSPSKYNRPGRERLVDHLPPGAFSNGRKILLLLGSKHTAVCSFCWCVLVCLTLMTCVDVKLINAKKMEKKTSLNYHQLASSPKVSQVEFSKKRPNKPQCFFHQSQNPLTPLLCTVKRTTLVFCWCLFKPHLKVAKILTESSTQLLVSRHETWITWPWEQGRSAF